MSTSRLPRRKQLSTALLIALRGVGGATFVLPAAGTKAFGLPADAEGSYLVRLFGARNLAMAGALLVSSGPARRLILQAGIACDALDIGAGVLGYLDGKTRKDAAVDTGLSAAATALGVIGLLTAAGERS